MSSDSVYLWTGGCLLSTGITGSAFMIHQQLKKGSSSYSLLSTSDVLAIFVTGVLFLVARSTDSAQMTDYAARNEPFMLEPAKCNYQTLIMNASLFLAPFVNAFMSIVAHSMACFCDARCMTSTSEGKFNFTVPARLKDRRIGLSLLMPWLVPLITTGTLLSSSIQEDSASLVKIYEDYNCNSMTPMEMQFIFKCFEEQKDDLVTEESVTSYKLLKNEHFLINKYKSEVQKKSSEIQNVTAIILQKIYSIVRETASSPHNIKEKENPNYSTDLRHPSREARDIDSLSDEDSFSVTEATTVSQTKESDPKETTVPQTKESSTEATTVSQTKESSTEATTVSQTKESSTEATTVSQTKESSTEATTSSQTKESDNENYKPEGTKSPTTSESHKDELLNATLESQTVNHESEAHTSKADLGISTIMMHSTLSTKYEEQSTQSNEFLVTFNGFPTTDLSISTENNTYDDICFTTCSFASQFLKGHLFILLFIGYFLPTAIAMIIYTTTYKHLDQNNEQSEVTKDDAVQCPGVQVKMAALNRMILQMIIMTIIFWTPTFIETLLRVWFCVSSPKWVTTALFVLGQLHGVARSVMNVKMVRLVTKGEVSTGLFKRNNGIIHPSTSTEGNTESSSKLFQKVKELLHKEEKPVAEAQ